MTFLYLVSYLFKKMTLHLFFTLIITFYLQYVFRYFSGRPLKLAITSTCCDLNLLPFYAFSINLIDTRLPMNTVTRQSLEKPGI